MPSSSSIIYMISPAYDLRLPFSAPYLDSICGIISCLKRTVKITTKTIICFVKLFGFSQALHSIRFPTGELDAATSKKLLEPRCSSRDDVRWGARTGRRKRWALQGKTDYIANIRPHNMIRLTVLFCQEWICAKLIRSFITGLAPPFYFRV